MKNYTSRMPVTESVEKIITALKTTGAFAVSEWVQGTPPVFITCNIPTDKGAIGTYKFAPDVKVVLATLTGSDEKKKAQAEITAWKSMLDFILIQCDRIALKQSTPMGAFMEFIYYPQQGITLMERLKLPANEAMASRLLTG